MRRRLIIMVIVAVTLSMTSLIQTQGYYIGQDPLCQQQNVVARLTSYSSASADDGVVYIAQTPGATVTVTDWYDISGATCPNTGAAQPTVTYNVGTPTITYTTPTVTYNVSGACSASTCPTVSGTCPNAPGTCPNVSGTCPYSAACPNVSCATPNYTYTPTVTTQTNTPSSVAGTTVNNKTTCTNLPIAFTFNINGNPITITNAAYSKDGSAQIIATDPYGAYADYVPQVSNTQSTCPSYSYMLSPQFGTFVNTASVNPNILAMEQTSLSMINQERIKNGLNPLSMDTSLQTLARMKSEDLAATNTFTHDSPTYGHASEMLDNAGYVYNAVGENLAHYGTVEKAHYALMSSEGHARNILGSTWTTAGVGVALDSQGYPIITQMFVR